LESTVTVSFLSLHLPVDKPERVLIEPNHQISVQRKSRGLPSDDNARCVRGCIQGYTTEISSISIARGKEEDKNWKGDVHGQTDINEQITAATSDEPSRSRREQDRDLNEIHRPKTTTDRKKDISVTTTHILSRKWGLENAGKTNDDEKNVSCFDHFRFVDGGSALRSCGIELELW
jgi:hypothetical protein